MKIDEIIKKIIAAEGGYVNSPNDPGGETNYGITKSTARSFGYAGEMADLPLHLAKKIYYQLYVIDPGFDQIVEVSEAVGCELIDTGVLMGQKTAAKILQRWLNVFNRQENLYKDLLCDGLTGFKTVDALKLYLDSRGDDGEAVLVKAMNCSQGQRMLEICENNEKSEDFIYGWISNRVQI